ncbi:hypothetical protein L1049_024179 [Liquidambar formosana]|uniref:non-specific serine/threonine protein kinase n=1 Tax=Liquidambar formosana TaxID=63359 RepID=A0AAP0RUV5_LIQFO
MSLPSSCLHETQVHNTTQHNTTMLLQVLLLLFLSPPLTLSLNQEGLYLLQLKQTLSDPSQSLSTWNSRDATPCKWTGVKCDGSAVTSLDLSDRNLAGPLPAAFLCRLTSLSSLSLYNNSFNSSLPVEISTCLNLRSLNLSQNLFDGSIPETLSDITNLTVLDLSGNSFSGDIPASFGGFRGLETLSLAGNFLNGTVPSFLGNVTSLKVLRLAYNPFAPSRLAPELGNLTSLEELWLAGCNLVGQIPESMRKLTRMTNFDLSLNGLDGSIPSWITEFKSAVQIELYNNSFSGRLPAGMSNLTALRRFDASTNQLGGTIPDELCRLPLESLNLNENGFEGSLPESISWSPNLYELKLFNNNLSGQLPSELGKNSPLERLDVSYNQFSGEIPANLCQKGSLGQLVLIYNSFSGEIPASLGDCRSLTRVRLENNRLSGEVPAKFWGLPNVYYLELLGNSFSGQVSNMISTAQSLQVLKISNNRFTGSIPDEIGLLSSLVEFSGDGNNFTGQIPAALLNLTRLGTLDVSDNGISGNIPAGIGSLKQLNELNLANNRLSGEIPASIGSLPVLNYLDLSRNEFSGEIPSELQNLKLNVLNLSDNRLSGDIPPIYAKENYRNSFLGNPGLCGDMVGLCPQRDRTKSQGYLWLLRSIFVLAGTVFIVGIVWFYWKYKKIKKAKKGMALSKWRSFHKLGFSELEIIDCLNEDNVIGSGASGRVYKVALSNGEMVAVKKLWGGSKKADASINSEKDGFEIEVETLGKIRHKNIVRLWCCYNTGDCKLLVYEYMPNGSLGDLLHSNKGGSLDWLTRYKIALDAAEGLSYLHHDCVPPIVHRDVKSNNILLDGEFGARVADFGVAKVVQAVSKGGESMSMIAGSCGYIAPEYAYTLRVNEKSDIYSFGVVILELVTGRPPIDAEFGEKDLVKWVCATLDQKGVDHVLDPKLDSSFKEEICRVLNIGLHCTSSLPISRPSMRRVVKMLQEAGADNKPKNAKKDGKLSPYYYEDASDQGSVVSKS